MKLGRVIGTVVCSVLYEGLEGVPMLWVQPLDKTLEPKGNPLVAADQTRAAGPGELVNFVAFVRHTSGRPDAIYWSGSVKP